MLIVQESNGEAWGSRIQLNTFLIHFKVETSILLDLSYPSSTYDGTTVFPVHVIS